MFTERERKEGSDISNLKNVRLGWKVSIGQSRRKYNLDTISLAWNEKGVWQSAIPSYTSEFLRKIFIVLRLWFTNRSQASQTGMSSLWDQLAQIITIKINIALGYHMKVLFHLFYTPFSVSCAGSKKIRVGHRFYRLHIPFQTSKVTVKKLKMFLSCMFFPD